MRPNKKSAAKKFPQRSWLRKSTSIAAGLAAAACALYLIAGFLLDPGFLARDANDKAGKVLGATTLSVRLIGPPEKPVIVAAGACSHGSPVVNLAWNAATDADYYNIDRDSSPLANNVLPADYQDSAVQTQTSYTYQVTAVGQAGSTVSDPVSVQTPADCVVIPPPVVTITALENKPLDTYGNPVTIPQGNPSFSGTSNIPNALIHADIYSQPLVSIDAVANENGFWTFQVPVALQPGLHTLVVTASDPQDATRTVTDSLSFTVASSQAASSGNQGNNHNKNNKNN